MYQKRRGVLDHAAEHFSNLLGQTDQLGMAFGVMYLQSLAKSSDESVSLFSPSQSVSLLKK
jgi:hypothetical protein